MKVALVKTMTINETKREEKLIVLFKVYKILVRAIIRSILLEIRSKADLVLEMWTMKVSQNANQAIMRRI